jgi:hypothetical protein
MTPDELTGVTTRPRIRATQHVACDPLRGDVSRDHVALGAYLGELVHPPVVSRTCAGR